MRTSGAALDTAGAVARAFARELLGAMRVDVRRAPGTEGRAGRCTRVMSPCASLPGGLDGPQQAALAAGADPSAVITPAPAPADRVLRTVATAA